MTRPTWDEARREASATGMTWNPHYVRGRKAKKYNLHYYNITYGLRAYMRKLDKQCAENPSSTFRVVFYGEHRELPTRESTFSGRWKPIPYHRKYAETYSGSNRSGELDVAAQAEAYRKLKELGVDDSQIEWEAEAEDVERVA